MALLINEGGQRLSPRPAARNQELQAMQRRQDGGGWLGPITSMIGGIGDAVTNAVANGRPRPRPEAPAEEPPPGMPPVDDQYVKQFQQNLAASRAQVQRQYDAALADINASEGRATQAVQQMPGMLQGIYGPAAAQIDTDTKNALAAQQGQHLQSFAGVDQGATPVRAAMTSSEASRKADVPLLQLGTQQTFATQRGGLDQARLRAEADLADQQTQFDMENRKQQDDFNRQVWLADHQDRQQAERDRRLHKYDLETQGLTLGQKQREAEKQRQQEARATLGTYGPNDTSAERAMAIRQLQPEQYKKLQAKAKKLWDATGRIQENTNPSIGGFFTPGGAIREGWRAMGQSQHHLSRQDRMKAIRGIGPRTRAVLNLLYGR